MFIVPPASDAGRLLARSRTKYGVDLPENVNHSSPARRRGRLYLGVVGQREREVSRICIVRVVLAHDLAREEARGAAVEAAWAHVQQR